MDEKQQGLIKKFREIFTKTIDKRARPFTDVAEKQVAPPRPKRPSPEELDRAAQLERQDREDGSPRAQSPHTGPGKRKS